MADQSSWFEKYWWLLAIVAFIALCDGKKKISNPPTQSYVATTSSGASHYVTTRSDPPELEDDPDTTNDESNDQPVGYYGTHTLCVYNVEAGNNYTLDVDVSEDAEVEQVYFPKSGWIYFSGCELDEDFEGDCSDNEGRSWQFQGEC
jgi:hypothetical protein